MASPDSSPKVELSGVPVVELEIGGTLPVDDEIETVIPEPVDDDKPLSNDEEMTDSADDSQLHDVEADSQTQMIVEENSADSKTYLHFYLSPIPPDEDVGPTLD